MNSKARDSTVGKDVEPQMRDAPLAVDLDLVCGISLELSLFQKRLPLAFGSTQPLGRRGTVDARHVDACAVRVVAREMRRVDHDSAHDAGSSESHDCPVVAGRAAAACFPPV